MKDDINEKNPENMIHQFLDTDFFTLNRSNQSFLDKWWTHLVILGGKLVRDFPLFNS
jgi:hypothetical protein